MDHLTLPLLLTALAFPFTGLAAEAAPAPPSGVRAEVALDEVLEGEFFWDLFVGQEVKGGKGALTLVKDQPSQGKYAMKLAGDFAGGGSYVGARKGFEDFDLRDVTAIRMKIKTENVAALTFRIGDGTGQTFQKKGIALTPDGQWHDLVIEPAALASAEHWGGANDGKWHGAPRAMALLLTKPAGEPKSISVLIADVRADAVLGGKSGEAVYREDFETEKALEGWAPTGAVRIEAAEAFKGKHALALEKTAATLRDPVAVVGPAFPVQPGTWEFGFAARTELDSMDNSYNGSLAVEALDGGGKRLAAFPLADLFRKNPWKPQKKKAEIPSGVVTARFVARINKETPGKFWIDDLSAAPVVGTKKDERIKRMMFSTAQLGNLLYPNDPREITVDLLAARPLPPEQQQVALTVRDYWGAEQAKPIQVTLAKAEKRQGKFFKYSGTASFAEVPLEIGRYYEVHGSVTREGNEPFTNYTSFAILPEAPANACKPEEVPFTSRNWDNRFGEFVKLTNRLGIRICGIWGKMEPDPKKVDAPKLRLVEEAGMGWLTGTPASEVELRVKDWETKWTEENLRQGVRNFLEKYGKVRPLIVNLGNEPHSKSEEDVKIDVNAYRIVYTEIKKIDPTIFVVGSSAGLQEQYFKAGFGEWLDAYDFHSYESPEGVRDTVAKKYPEMFKKYGFAKPVWATEVGLNSQGMARQFVAAALYKKFVNFFAGGGANVSWFGFLYPDPEGRNADSFASAHNVFDCRYSRYAPKLDAIAYYNAVNGIAIKKFAQDKTYSGDMHAFLFRDRDNKALQVWYKDKGREDVFLPLPGVGEVEVIRIDGSRGQLHADGKGITLSVTEDPMLLLYSGGEGKLPESLGAPALRLGATTGAIVRGEKSGFAVALESAKPDQVSLRTPPFWKVGAETVSGDGGKPVLRYTLEAPEDSTARQADCTVELKDAAGRIRGQISYRPEVTGALSARLLPVPAAPGQDSAVRLVVQNNSPEKQAVEWEVALTGEQALASGKFNAVGPTETYFKDAASGTLELGGKQSGEIILPLADADLYKVYRTKAVVKDASGRTSVQERPLAAFYGVPKAASPPAIDGLLDDPAWKNAPVRMLDKADQFFAFALPGKPVQDWASPKDLSAEIRYLWDDAFFYVSVKVTDDVWSKTLQQDNGLWMQDSLQFLIDPMRTSDRKIGKYEYSLADGKQGPQVWCTLTADAGAPSGNVKDIKLTVKHDAEGGGATYEVAIPWSRLAPFKPAADANLGFTLIVNEDDGNGRDSFMTWFGNAHTKDIDTVGDLILLGH
jgi:hypothetical protein